jgi:hypothetical protein
MKNRIDLKFNVTNSNSLSHVFVTVNSNMNGSI